MMGATFYFSGWEPLVRIVVVGTAMYITLVLLLRISSSRTLSSMNAFDFVITVAIGSAFGRALTTKSVALAEAVVAFALLIGLQYLVTSIQVRWDFFGRAITNPPVLLYFRGEFLEDAMHRERVRREELQSAVRKKKLATLDDVEAVVLESSGEFSVIKSVSDSTRFGETLDKELEP